MSQYQYQQEVGPFASGPATETLADKWHYQLPAPVRRIPSSALLMAAMIVPVFVPTPADAPQTVDRWKSNYPDRIERTRFSRAAHLAAAQNVEPLPNVVQSPSGGSFISTGAYTLWQYQSLAGPLVETTAPPELALNWQPIYPDAIRQKAGLRASLHLSWVMDKFSAPTAATVPDAGWAFTQPDQVRGRAPNHYRAPFFAMDTQWTAPPQNIATTLWMPKGVDLPPRTVFSRAAYTWAQPHFVVEVDVPVMSWTGLYLDPPVRAKSNRSLVGSRIVSPFQIADVTDPAPPLSWNAYQPEQTRRPVNSIAAKTSTHVGPVFVSDVIDPTPTLAWQGRYPDRIAAKTSVGTGSQKAWFFDAIYTAPTPATAPALAKPVYPDRVPGRPQPTIHPDTAAPNFVLDVTVPAPLLSWAPHYPDRPVTMVRQPELSMTFTRVMTPPPTFRISWISDVSVHGPMTPVTPVQE